MIDWITWPTAGSIGRVTSKAPAKRVVPTPSVCTPILSRLRAKFGIMPKMPIEPVMVDSSA
ncbi:hypothetical protein D3C71_1601180 [compost metagenome]